MESAVGERETTSPWRVIGVAMWYCASFPEDAFRRLLSAANFDVRWPMTFACWYFLASGARCDKQCVHFLRRANLIDDARRHLTEYSNESPWDAQLRALMG